MTLINPGPLEWDTTIQWDPDSPMDTGWVEVPFDLKATFGKGNMVPVVATFDGSVTYRGIISKMPFACVILRKDVRAALGKGGGDPGSQDRARGGAARGGPQNPAVRRLASDVLV